ncbi:MAG TPA: gamma carbonic anhydrase family protein, partial [Gemmatimonadaceae bacterium]|nr:gamma carbonic anhydrase family protein [Gemmatimonadaceae bacterium]
IRGDSDKISVGAESNIQDGAVLHADEGAPCTIGARVTVGHRAIVHGATVEDNCLIGMGAIVLNHAVIGEGSLIGAGAVVPEDMVVPPGSIVLGVPGRVVKQVDKMTRARIQHGVDAYLELAEQHREGKYPRTRGKGE